MSGGWDGLIADIHAFTAELELLKMRTSLAAEPWMSILAERRRTAEAYGDRGLETLDPVDPLWLPILVNEVGTIGDLFRESPEPNDQGFLKALRKEAVQVAAVATAWITAIDAQASS